MGLNCGRRIVTQGIHCHIDPWFQVQSVIEEQVCIHECHIVGHCRLEVVKRNVLWNEHLYV